MDRRLIDAFLVSTIAVIVVVALLILGRLWLIALFVGLGWAVTAGLIRAWIAAIDHRDQQARAKIRKELERF